MPKIRGVKPDYWTDEDIVELSIPARLLFIGLWTYACDNGHLQDKPKQIKMRLLPGDDVNAAELLRELADKGRIQRTDGWITIPGFVKHQRPDRRYWQTCERPDCTRPEPDSQRETRGGHRERPTSTPRAHTVVSPSPPGDGEGDGELKVMVSTSGGPDEPAASSDEQTAQTLIAEWIERNPQRPPGRVVGQVSKELKTMLDEGIPYDDVRAGLAAWHHKGLHPATLPSVVHETRKAGTSEPDSGWNARILPTPPPDVADDPQLYAEWLAEQRQAG